MAVVLNMIFLNCYLLVLSVFGRFFMYPDPVPDKRTWIRNTDFFYLSFLNFSLLNPNPHSECGSMRILIYSPGHNALMLFCYHFNLQKNCKF